MTTETVSIERTDDSIIQHERWTSTRTVESKTVTRAVVCDGKVVLSIGSLPEEIELKTFRSFWDTKSETFRPEDAEHLADILRKLAAEARQSRA